MGCHESIAEGKGHSEGNLDRGRRQCPGKCNDPLVSYRVKMVGDIKKDPWKALTMYRSAEGVVVGEMNNDNGRHAWGHPNWLGCRSFCG